MDDITITEQLLQTVSLIKSWVKTWVTGLVSSVSDVFATSIAALDQNKVNKSEYDAEVAAIHAKLTLLEEEMTGELANPWEMYLDNLTGIIYSNPGDIVYNEEYQRLEMGANQ